MASKFSKSKKEMFGEIREILMNTYGEESEYVQFVDHEIELNSSSRRVSEKVVAERQSRCDVVLTYLETVPSVTCSDIFKANMSTFDNVQQVNSTLKTLMDNGAVVRNVKGKSVTFSKV